jgi:8-oxo-dGTP pyrophosphatase MutT (NUDIX family)
MIDLAEGLPDRIAQQLIQPLPGHDARRRFAHQLSYGRHCGPPRWDARQATVVALLVARNGRWYVVLTVRHVNLAEHGGQVSLPGGSLEAGETASEAALRELEEEIGICAHDVALLGPLTPLYVFASNFHVTPFVAVCAVAPTWRGNEIEVAEILELPLDVLCDADRYGQRLIDRGGCVFSAPCICWQSHDIWGATAMILGELAAVLENCQPPIG